MVYVAEEFNLTYLIPLGMGIFGLFGIVLGIDTFTSGRIEMFNHLYSRREKFSDVPARLLGIMIFLFGAGVIFYAFIEWTQPGMAGEFLAGLVGPSRGWGILLITFGFFTLLFGLIRLIPFRVHTPPLAAKQGSGLAPRFIPLIAGSAHRPKGRSGLVDFRYRARGLVNVVVGVLMFVAGV